MTTPTVTTPSHPALRRWLASADAGQRMTHADLARQLGYSLAYVYGVLGGSAEMTSAFRGRFLDEFGPEAAALAFYGEADPEPEEETACN